MNNIFKPSKAITRCPICGVPLNISELDSFGLPIGYRSECNCCEQYSDIWISGLREVTAGQYTSPDYISNDASMKWTEKIKESFIVLCINLSITASRFSREMHSHHRSKTHKHVSA